jgi:phosphate transport system substrate-binding protein
MKNFKHLGSALMAAGLVFASLPAAAQSRDQINIVGSSTVYPFATVVAENFGNSTKFRTPKIEPTGSGGGLKAFCAGIGVQHPDITNSSRRIKQSEIDLCGSNGVDEIVEVNIGYDGIVIANSVEAPQIELTRRDIFLALAKHVPNPDSNATEKLIENPYTTWQEINSELPAVTIEVLGPPPTSGTRDAFVELAMEGGCKTFDFIAAMKKTDKNGYKALCHTMREDGKFVEVGENDNLIVTKLNHNKSALGIFGFSFLDQNSDSVQGATVDGQAPTFDAIADGSYPVSRPLYFYVKKAHIGTIPGIQEYIDEFVSDNAIGEDGYLTDKGLIPLPDEERAKVLSDVAGLISVKLAAAE